MKSLPRGSLADPIRACTRNAAALAAIVPLESLLCATEARANAILRATLLCIIGPASAATKLPVSMKGLKQDPAGRNKRNDSIKGNETRTRVDLLPLLKSTGGASSRSLGEQRKMLQ